MMLCYVVLMYADRHHRRTSRDRAEWVETIRLRQKLAEGGE